MEQKLRAVNNGILWCTLETMKVYLPVAGLGFPAIKILKSNTTTENI